MASTRGQPMDEAMIAAARQANEPYLASYPRRLAEEIVAMLPEARDDALRVLAFVDAMLNVKVPPRQPRPSDPQLPAA